jgi:phosphate transport system substrate-binding protein
VASNDAMATALVQQPGAIGYLEMVYLNGRRGVRAAALQNSSAAFVTPSDTAVQTALHQGSGDSGAYPLTTYSWLVMSRRGLGAKGSVLKRAITYGLSASGQASARTLGYAALPEAVLENARRSLEAWQP